MAAGYRDGSHAEKFQGQSRQVTVKTVGYTGWKLVGVAPADSWLASSSQLFLFGLALLLSSSTRGIMFFPLLKEIRKNLAREVTIRTASLCCPDSVGQTGGAHRRFRHRSAQCSPAHPAHLW